MIRRLLMVVLIFGLVVGAFYGPPAVADASWPASWTLLGTDPNESGTDNHRDVIRAYFASDPTYFYFRVETVDPSGWPSTTPSGAARYKWFFDVDCSDAFLQGQIVYQSEFLLMLEDMTNNAKDPSVVTPTDPNWDTRDKLGEITFLDDLANVGFFNRWDTTSPQKYTNNGVSPQSTYWRRELGTGTAGAGGPQSSPMNRDIGYRVTTESGKYYVDMYMAGQVLGQYSDFCFIWVTDNQGNNLDQGPNLDTPDGGAFQRPTVRTATTSSITSTVTSTIISNITNYNTTLTRTSSTSRITNPTTTHTITTITQSSGSEPTTYTSATTYTTSYTRSTTTSLLATSHSVYTTESTLVSSEFVGISTTATVSSSTSSTSSGTVYVTEYVTFQALENWLQYVTATVRAIVTELYQILFELKVDPTVDETIVVVVPTSSTSSVTSTSSTSSVTSTSSTSSVTSATPVHAHGYPSGPVGGEMVSVNKLNLIAPYLALFALVAVGTIMLIPSRRQKA